MLYRLLLALIIVTTACQGTKSTDNINNNTNEKKSMHEKEKVKLVLHQTNNEKVATGDTIYFNFESSVKSNPDSIKVSIDYQFRQFLKPIEKILTIPTNDCKTGNRTFGFTFYWGDSLKASIQEKVSLTSNIIPENFTYKIVKTYSHDTRFYTQGLEFVDGYLFEGTGQYGESTLNKISLEQNEVVQSVSLDKDVFGEGITILNDKIYQLTWRSSTGFVYDKNSFKKLYDFNYPTEGWGLTNNGEDLIMSDGSEVIYFLDTDYIQEKRRIEVYDNKGPVSNLNELEFINGLIYANVYTTKTIVVIDPETGKVLKKANFNGILNNVNTDKPIDVMNGIAWDNQGKRLIVTGKWWPAYFHVKLLKK